MSRPDRPLGSTYRLQLSGFGFERARRLVPYLSALGVETLYVSPILAASAGSTHGYDVIDPTRLDPSLGTSQEFEALLCELDGHGMRVLIDTVPNHMAAEAANRWWWDVLAFGERSVYAAVFDIDWAAGDGKVLVATLAAPLAELVARGKLRVDLDKLELEVGTEHFPLNPATVGGGEGRRVAEKVLARQHYRPGYWRLQRTEGNYRRFFDIDRLIGVRVEDPAVYDETHRFLLQLAADPRVAGLRIDDIDGLADPGGYVHRLRADLERGHPGTSHLVVEKIVARDEWLPSGWDVEGTTGYEFADLSTRLLVDPAGAQAFEALGERVTGDDRPFDELARQGRAFVLDELFVGQLDRLAVLGLTALEQRQPGIDLAVRNVRAAARALIAHLDVYRTYLGGGAVHRTDGALLARASAGAARRLRAEDARALGEVVRLLCDASDRETNGAGARHRFATRFEQLSGAVAAKGVEDTACYRTHGLLASAEVGGDLEHPALSVEDLHAELALRARRSPGGLNGLSTHDSKRSADVRARLAALSEVSTEWERLVRRWRRRHGVVVAEGGLDPHDELFFYQSLVGIWPIGAATAPAELRDRLQGAMQKAAREAKVRTGWLEPDPEYEGALASFVDAALDDTMLRAELDGLLRRIGPAAATNALAMTVLAGVAPGVPDLYQGSESWQLALMDPDNRRAVDFVALETALHSLPDERQERWGADARALLEDWPDGRLKLWVTRAVLQLRRRRPELFSSSSYVPLEVRGRHRDRVVAFARRRGRQWVIAVVPRLTISLMGPGRFAVGTEPWGGTKLVLPDRAPAGYVDALTGRDITARRGALAVEEVLGVLPVALLSETGGGVRTTGKKPPN